MKGRAPLNSSGDSIRNCCFPGSISLITFNLQAAGQRTVPVMKRNSNSSSVFFRTGCVVGCLCSQDRNCRLWLAKQRTCRHCDVDMDNLEDMYALPGAEELHDQAFLCSERNGKLVFGCRRTRLIFTESTCRTYFSTELSLKVSRAASIFSCKSSHSALTARTAVSSVSFSVACGRCLPEIILS